MFDTELFDEHLEYIFKARAQPVSSEGEVDATESGQFLACENCLTTRPRTPHSSPEQRVDQFISMRVDMQVSCGKLLSLPTHELIPKEGLGHVDRSDGPGRRINREVSMSVVPATTVLNVEGERRLTVDEERDRRGRPSHRIFHGRTDDEPGCSVSALKGRPLHVETGSTPAEHRREEVF